MIAEDLAALSAFVPGQQSVEAMATRLYVEWYLDPRPARPQTGPPTAVEVSAAAALDAAHAAGDRFEPGWTAALVSTTGRVKATNGQTERLVELGSYVDLDRPGRCAEPGDRLLVTARRSGVEDGFWISRSSDWSELPLTRLYVNISLPKAPIAVTRITSALDGHRYALKVALATDGQQRPDSLVIYLERDAYHRELAQLLAPCLADLIELLEPWTPRLTASLAPGIAAADGAADGSSYGAELCRHLAAALHPGSDPATVALDLFRQLGLNPDRPYLEAGETRDYYCLN
ncbi:T3SS effector HopA1 family protein [Kribbella sp. NPDC026611]|uniref:T3SS effector HopA1 family protein n=1 Tax=Kribbella sp. NPDC026611 TaxID=3154911 RepID=UPI0033FC0B51